MSLTSQTMGPPGLPADGAAVSEEIAISCHENEVPGFAAAEIDRLYTHLNASFRNFQVAKQLPGASTYVVRRGGAVATVFLFTRARDEARVISEFIRLDREEIRRFAEYIFGNFPAINVIAFNKIHAVDLDGLPYPHHAVNTTEDIVVTLPATVKEYEAGVGKNMRRNIRRYTGLLQQDFPSYSYRVYQEQDISEQDVRDIVRLNHARMADKNIVSRIDEEETQWIVQLARQCGLVSVARIANRVCGGMIAFRIGQRYFMHVIAHDPRYNDYSLGILCYYLTICEVIARGGKYCHLLSGRYEYKYRLLGVTQDIAHIDIYRNRVHALLCSARIVSKAATGHIREARLWLLEAERRNDAASRLAARLMRALRTLKRSQLGWATASRSGTADE